ncbi:hypothetical protein MKQ70_12240 [Chitinophaga sedimenti]|uniref:hypothetical protein n=1 Tax=Chitinophaga sedimenti TaxID=2033606 RepID=UPI0020059F6D|nr:hypothetical protein [Chitinophaga sedimenti]MCK7555745.1 hypothetical protein [Chitinophaga sedimenti]
MRSTLPLLAFLLLFTACNKEDFAHENAYEKSYKAWLSFKAESNNAYTYTVTSASIFGFSSATAITVKNGVVTARTYVAKGRDTNGQLQTTFEYTEDAATLNTNERGGACITLDEVYAEAKKVYLVKKKDRVNYFETTNNGMISFVGQSVGSACVDDCVNGIRISTITKLN